MSTTTDTETKGGGLKIEFGPRLADVLQPGYSALSTTAQGGVRSAAFRPARSDIWCVEGHLDEGAELSWDSDHGDEVVHVLDGSLSFADHICPTGSAVILDAEVPALLTATSPTRVLHFGAALAPPQDGPFGAPSRAGRAVHVIGPRGIAEYTEPGREARYWADGSADTNRVTLFSSRREGPDQQVPHSHSVDEIFMITEGEIVVGRRHISEGMVVFVTSDQRYAFRGGDQGYLMINYRPDASYYMLPGVRESPIEGVRWPGITLVDDVIA